MDNKGIIEITEQVKWIGILDYDIVTFDVVMETEYGTTYNSYFIDADKKSGFYVSDILIGQQTLVASLNQLIPREFFQRFLNNWKLYA